MAGIISADQLQASLSLLLRDSEFRQKVWLNAAKIDGNLDLNGSSFGDDLDADSVRVGAALYMRATSFKGVILSYAKVTGLVGMEGAMFEGDLDARSLQTGADVFMSENQQGRASFKAVNLDSAKIAGLVDLHGATLDGSLSAASIQIGADLIMNSTEQNSRVQGREHFGRQDHRQRLRGRSSCRGRPARAVSPGWRPRVAEFDASQPIQIKNVTLAISKVGGNVSLQAAEKLASSTAFPCRAGPICCSIRQCSPRSILDWRRSPAPCRSAERLLERSVHAVGAQIGADLMLNALESKPASFKSVELGNLNIGGNLSIFGAVFAEDFNAQSLQVGTSINIGSTPDVVTRFKAANFLSSIVKGSIGIAGAEFEGDLNVGLTQIGAHLLLGPHEAYPTTFKTMYLVGARIGGNLSILGAEFGGDLNADLILVGAHLLAHRSATARSHSRR